MNAGSLNKYITLQQSTRVSDGMGGFTLTYADVASLWAAIWPISANETVAANATTMVVSHRIRIRYRSVLKASWRIKFGARYFAIVGIINPNERCEWLDILCKEAS
jgi:SPP1 family predicted phage head-tail adaptor